MLGNKKGTYLTRYHDLIGFSLCFDNSQGPISLAYLFSVKPDTSRSNRLALTLQTRSAKG